MRTRFIGTDPATRREVSALSLGAMLMGSRTDERTSFEVLDRYVEAGGTFIDTSNNYAYWEDGGQGGASEQLLGRWLKSRGVGSEVVVATKLGARPLAPGTGYVDNPEGLSPKTIREAVDRSRENLGVEKLDVLYAHIEDPGTPLQDTVEGFGAVVAEGSVGLLGVSNHWTWKIERARNIARAAGLPAFELLQYHHSYLRPRTDLPTPLSVDGGQGAASGDLLSYVRESGDGLTLVAYSPLLGGAYVNDAKPLGADFDHPGTVTRLAALREVAAELGAPLNQVVLAWQLGHDLPIIPLVGASSVAQLDDSLAALELELSAEQRAKLDAAG
ncbi:aldo/keto reductase [Streptomyces sp. NPDC060194]|uniref:aldo/keto reductase n=1 Tax=Streptomyces sp. NPDC060194 TaxID=3347069 RepID=UPI003652B025